MKKKTLLYTYTYTHALCRTFRLSRSIINVHTLPYTCTSTIYLLTYKFIILYASLLINNNNNNKIKQQQYQNRNFLQKNDNKSCNEKHQSSGNTRTYTPKYSLCRNLLTRTTPFFHNMAVRHYSPADRQRPEILCREIQKMLRSKRKLPGSCMMIRFFRSCFCCCCLSQFCFRTFLCLFVVLSILRLRWFIIKFYINYIESQARQPYLQYSGRSTRQIENTLLIQIVPVFCTSGLVTFLMGILKIMGNKRQRDRW